MRKTLISLMLAPLIIVGCSSIDQKRVLITPLPPKTTSAHYTLEMERFLGANEEDFKKINDFLGRVDKRVKLKREYTEKDAKQILGTIHEEVQKLFNGVEEGELFYNSIRTGKADCERFTIPYLSAAERLNLPITAVFAFGGKRVISGIETNISSHVFIRWKFQKPIEQHLNLECIYGVIMPDEYYSRKYAKLSEIPNFPAWCITTRLDWCAKQYGTNYSSAVRRAEELKKRLR